MNNHEIDFLKNKTYIGVFYLPDDKEVMGQLIYQKNSNFELKLFSDFPLDKEKETAIPFIYGKIHDEQYETYFISLKDCQLFINSLGSYGYQYQVFFDVALFSRHRTFDFSKDSIKSINLFYSNWNEFCYPQGFKSHAPYINKMLSFRVKPGLRITFNQNISNHYLPEKGIFDSIFCSSKLSNKEKSVIEKQLEQTLIPYKDKIGIKIPDKHDWLININTVRNIEDLYPIIYDIKSLLTCLTYDFSTNIDKIRIVSNNGEEKYDSSFFMLKHIHISERRSFYHHQSAPFKLNTFTQNEWATIFKRLFNNKNKLNKYFFILLQNHADKVITEFSLTNYLTCIDAIGNSKKYGKIKYELVLSNFASELKKDDKNKLLNLFRKELKFVKVKNEQKKKLWGLIGLKISELRALTVHFNDKNTETDMSKCIEIYRVLELIIIDYIFECLQIEKEKRVKYKEHYISQILRDC